MTRYTTVDKRIGGDSRLFTWILNSTFLCRRNAQPTTVQASGLPIVSTSAPVPGWQPQPGYLPYLGKYPPGKLRAPAVFRAVRVLRGLLISCSQNVCVFL